MKKRILAILSLLVAVTCLSFGLAGCGESSGNGGSTGGSQTEQGGGTEGGTGSSQGEQGGETCAHQFTADNVCSLCGDKWEFTEGLTYELDDETDTYHVLHIQKESGDVVVPYGYQGKFVTAVYGWTMEEIQEMMAVRPGGMDAMEQFFVYSLTGITLPDSVTSIGDYSFIFCQGLKSANLGKGLASIGDGAFGMCTKLTSIKIPNSVTSIKDEAFFQCSGLESLVIEGGAISIGGYAFTGCGKLESIIISSGVTSISIDEGAFYQCSALKSIIIESGVISIGSGAFDDCSELTDIQFNGTVAAWQDIEKIGDWDRGAGEYTVTCLDGTVDKDGNVTYFE